ncbi:TrkA C-terminal domain-containing protein [Pseudoflavonifractor phocaeensis]|uniref:TrkA C-terminal domain-containing protein n=1 Tax=Pseudoflavonifractor phocaeensis TaxID=1870988 RepID=UPI0030904FCD|nr:GntR family transcriptional regulator [Oscillospiraceae bacterium]
MRRAEHIPIYAQVAHDMAAKIAAGELGEGVRFTGRSLMGSQYGVSQETIRRALGLLADVGVVTIRQNVGAEVASRSRAAEYVEQSKADSDLLALRTRLRELIAQRDRLNGEITDTFQRVMDLEERFRSSDRLRTYEFALDPQSPAVGRNLQDLQFRQRTGATVVALRRGEEARLSPGPDAALEAGDVLVVACNAGDIERVSRLLREECREEATS